MSVYGYIRVSTGKQDADTQRYEIEKYCAATGIVIADDHWIEETVSGAKDYKRRKLGGLIDTLEQGDLVICTELSRLSRSIMSLCALAQELFDRGIRVYSIKQSFELRDDLQSKLMLVCLSMCAEVERDLISQRTRQALEKKRLEGVKLGRKPGSLNKVVKLTPKEPAIRILLAEGHSKAKIARLLGVDRSTLSRYINQRINGNP